jgi:putative hydrolase
MPDVSDPAFDPFQGLPFLGDLAKMAGAQGPISWDAARQMAMSVAAGGISEPNVDPIERMAFESVARVAELQVTDVTGLDLGLVRVSPVTATTWAMRSLDAYKPLFEKLGAALAGTTRPQSGDEASDPQAAMLSGLLSMLAPMTLGMSAGSMVGHLARRSFGQYHLPIPRPADGEVLVLPRNVTAFADDWSLPLDDLRLWVCVHELTHHGVLSVPHVRGEVETLVTQFVSSFRPSPDALTERLESLDPTDTSLASIQRLFSDPEMLLGVMRSDDQQAMSARLDAVVSMIVGYVDHVLDIVGQRLIGSYGSLSEAVRRHRVEADQADVFVARLLGLSIGQDQVERGRAFVSGVVERGGDVALSRLWISQRELPTPAEIDAPGLWLARIDL